MHACVAAQEHALHAWQYIERHALRVVATAILLAQCSPRTFPECPMGCSGETLSHGMRMGGLGTTEVAHSGEA